MAAFFTPDPGPGEALAPSGLEAEGGSGEVEWESSSIWASVMGLFLVRGCFQCGSSCGGSGSHGVLPDPLLYFLLHI